MFKKKLSPEQRTFLDEMKEPIMEMVLKEIKPEVMFKAKEMTKSMAVNFTSALSDLNNKLEQVAERKVQRLYNKLKRDNG